MPSVKQSIARRRIGGAVPSQAPNPTACHTSRKIRSISWGRRIETEQPMVSRGENPTHTPPRISTVIHVSQGAGKLSFMLFINLSSTNKHCPQHGVVLPFGYRQRSWDHNQKSVVSVHHVRDVLQQCAHHLLMLRGHTSTNKYWICSTFTDLFDFPHLSSQCP